LAIDLRLIQRPGLRTGSALHPGLAGKPPGPDLAQIWRSPARSGLPAFLLFLFSPLNSNLIFVLYFKSI
jgi:hypothetical protein